MHYLRLIPFLFFSLLMFGGLQPVLAQTPTSTFMVPDLSNSDFHRKCGIDHAIEQRLATDPDYATELERFKNDIPQLVENSRNIGEKSMVAPIINVPVVVHVIHSGEPVGTGMNISDAQIQAQIDVLNEDFAALNETFLMTPSQWQASIGNPEINYCLAAIDPNGNPTNGITRDQLTVTGTTIANSNIETVIKPATWWDSDEYYNIWVLPIPGTTEFGGTTGFAYYPTGGVIGTSTDGSVVDHDWFGGPGFGQSGYKTLTHETGHYLGLPHTFDDYSCSADDGFADTPNIDDETSAYTPGLNCSPNNFPTGPTSCTNEHMYVNYMDYVNDDYCYTSFSNDQIALMRAVLDGNVGGTGFASRLPLASNAVSVCTFFDNDAGTTDILYPSTFLCESGQITPEVVITNFGQNNLNSVTINYQINNNTPVSLIWGTNLATAEKDTVFLAPYTPPGGLYTFTVYTTLPNGVADEQLPNDTMSLQTVAINPLPLPLLEDFEATPFNPTVNGVFTFDISGDGNVWERSTAVSGYGNGGASAMFDNWTPAVPLGTIDALISPIYNFSAVTGAQVTFDVAYTYYDDGTQVLTDTLIMLVSTNCGSNYVDQIYVKGGDDLSTAPSTTGLFTPGPSQWRTETVDLSAYDGEDNLSIMFVNFYGYGNRLFIDNINISLPCNMTLSASGTDPACAGDCTGQASVTPSGGSGTYDYTWSANAGGATTAVVNNLCAGNYIVTVSDGVSCTDTISVTLTGPPVLSMTVTTTNETAVGANDGTATANPTGGNNSNYTYAWSNSAGDFQMISNLAPDTYTVTVTDASGCSYTDVFVIEAYDCGAYAISVTGTDINCFGANNGSATATVSSGTGTAPFTYTWSPSGGNMATINNLPPGPYSVTVTDASGCSDFGSYTVVEPPALSLTVSTTDETVAGANDGTATANPTGGSGTITYSWSNTGNTQMITNLPPGPYSVTATDANGCTAESSGTVLPGPVDCSGFSISVTTTTTITCNGLCDGSISLSVNSTATPFTFDWNDNALDGIQNPSNLCAAAYSVTVTDNDGCSATLTQEITEVPVLTLDLTATNQLCNGSCDATVTAAGGGGTPPYSMEIDGGSFTNLCAAIYGVTITDDNGCTETSTIEVIETPLDVASITATPSTCNNECDGSITTSITGNGPFTYTWNIAGSGPGQNNLCAGNYSVTIENANGCSTILTTTVTEPTAVVVNMSATPISGSGLNNGTATASPTGGTPGYTYLWSPGGEITPTITGLAPNTYSVVVTDSNDCTATETVVINPFDCGTFSGAATATNVVCYGLCNGTITTTISGGASPFTYDWSDNSLDGEANPSGLCADSYSVTITDNDGCSTVVSADITEPDPLSVTLSGTGPTSPGANDGTITANPMGGTGNYQYLWSPNGEMTQTINNLPPNTYSVVVTDDNGCTATEVFIIQNIDCSGLSMIMTFDDVTCNGGNDGTATVDVSGGLEPYVINWDNTGNGTQITGLIAGTYCATVTDNQGCTTNACVTVGEAEAIVIEELSSQGLVCAGDDNASVTVSVSGGSPLYTYLWCNGQTSATVTNLPAGNCMLTVTDNNACTMAFDWFVSDPLPLDLTISSNDESAPGAADGTAIVIANGESPFTYLWSTNDNSINISGLVAGVYTVTVTDNNGCTSEASVVVGSGTVDCSSFALGLSLIDVSCFGLSDGVAVASPSGGAEPYEYLWNTGSMDPSINSLPAGSYTCQVTDANGCIIQQSFDIVEPPLLDVTVTGTDETTAGANDGTATATASGGTLPYSFEWCNGAVTAMVTGLPPGNCEVVITDGNACTTTASVIIEPGGIDCSGFGAIVNTTDVSCFDGADGTALALVTGGTIPFSYSWSNGENTPEIINLVAGQYQVTVTDGNDCETIQTTFILQPTQLSFTLSTTDETTPGANDGTATASASGGTPFYTYQWCNGQTGTMATGLSPGFCTLLVTDANGCTLSETFLIESAGVDCSGFGAIVTTEPVSCYGFEDGSAMASISGGIEPYNYNWSTGPNTSSITNLFAGLYSVTIIDGNGCEVIQNGIVSQPEEIIVSIMSTDETMPGANDGTATATASGGVPPFTYLWCDGQTTAMATNLSAGICQITITDASGCQQIEEVIIETIPVDCSGLTMTQSVEEVSCFGGADGVASVQVNGGFLPYSYAWSNGGNTATISNLTAGPYSVTVTDALGCILLDDFIVPQPLAVDVSATGFDGACGSNGSAVASSTGGTAPFSYSWSTGATGNFISDLPAGPYQVTATDANGCTGEDAVLIFVNSEGINVDIDVSSVSCYGDTDGDIDVTVLSGTAPFSFLWNTGDISDDLFDVPADLYTIYITDAAGCLYLSTIEVGSPAPLSISIMTTPANNGSNGSATAVVSGGTTPYSYNWNGPQTVFINNLSSGSYTVTVTDANGCTAEKTTIIGTSAVADLPSLLSLTLFPNPSNGVFVLTADFSVSEEVEVLVYNLLGQVIFYREVEGQSIQVPVDIRDQANGTYLVQLKTEHGFVVRKVVKSGF